jgi:NAD(P)-dependent dehydrogenase (short-subunit alcohol dehydrogenase family)
MRVLGKAGLHDQATMERVLAVNVVGSFNVLRFAAAEMAKNEAAAGGRGVIINTASVAAYEGQIGQVAYAASKGAIVSMTLPAAREFARIGIRVMTIAPGVADTKMMSGFGEKVRSALELTVPFPARMAFPEEFAALAISIIEHDYLNGETIRMDGALRMAAK